MKNIRVVSTTPLTVTNVHATLPLVGHTDTRYVNESLLLSTLVSTPVTSPEMGFGVLTSVDNNNDSLTYRVSVWPTKGSVRWTFMTVNGVVDTTRMFFTYTPTAAARQVAAAPGATSADQSDSFTVTVSDGYGGTVNVEIEVPIGVVVG